MNDSQQAWADNYGRRENILNLWAQGFSNGQIAEQLNLDTSCIDGVVIRARRAGDVRAAPHNPSRRSHSDHYARDHVLDAWAEGKNRTEIAEALKLDGITVRCIIEGARAKGDPRAAKRIEAVAVEPKATGEFPAETRSVYSLGTSTHHAPAAVSVRSVSIGKPDALRPVRESVERQAARRIDLTAALMGDPDPSRSALGRPIRPDEYASRSGEGKYRDRSAFVHSVDREYSHVGISASKLAKVRYREEAARRGHSIGLPVRNRINTLSAPLHGGKETI